MSRGGGLARGGAARAGGGHIAAEEVPGGFSRALPFKKMNLGRSLLKRQKYDSGAKLPKEFLVGVNRAQAATRRFLVRREYRGLQTDQSIVFGREALLKALFAFPRMRSSAVCGVCYLVFFGLILSVAALALPPSMQYEAGGFLAENILFEDVTGSNVVFGMDTIHTPSELYTFMTTAIAAKLVQTGSGSSTVTFLGNPGAASVINPITIAQVRSTTTKCTSLYTQPTSQDAFNNDLCALPLTEGVNQAAYGTTTNKDVFDILIPNLDNQYIGSTATKCPKFTFRTDQSSTFPDGSHSLAIPTAWGSTDVTNVISMLSRCGYIDQLTRKVAVEVDLFVGNEKPLYTIMSFVMKFSLNGQSKASYKVLTVDTTNPDVSDSSVATLVILSIMSACVVLGLHLIVIDTAVFALKTSLLWALRHTLGMWSVVSLTQYGLVIAALSIFVTLEGQQRDVAEYTLEDGSKDFLDFKANLKVLASLNRAYSIVLGLLVFVSFFRLLQFTRHRGMVSLVQRAVSRVAVPLCHFIVGVLPIFVGFIALSHLIFGNGILELSTYSWAIQTNMLALFGSDIVAFKRMSDFDTLSAWVFTISFYIIAVVVVMSFLISIVLEGYREMTANPDVHMRADQEALNQFVHFLESHSPYIMNSEQMVWQLLHEPSLKNRKVSLRDLKMLYSGVPAKEILDTLFFLADVPPSVSNSSFRIYSAPYRYFHKRAKYPWLFKYSPGGFALELHLLCFRYILVKDFFVRACKLLRFKKMMLKKKRDVAKEEMIWPSFVSTKRIVAGEIGAGQIMATRALKTPSLKKMLSQDAADDVLVSATEYESVTTGQQSTSGSSPRQKTDEFVQDGSEGRGSEVGLDGGDLAQAEGEGVGDGLGSDNDEEKPSPPAPTSRSVTVLPSQERDIRAPATVEVMMYNRFDGV